MPINAEPNGLAESIRRALLPIDEARGLANSAYTDPALFEFERDHLMTDSWVALAFERDLPEPGFALPVDFMGLPLLLLRNSEGVISVVHNVCSHRGMMLVREPGVVQGSLRCPYHSWNYGLDGALRGTPHIGGVGIPWNSTTTLVMATACQARVLCATALLKWPVTISRSSRTGPANNCSMLSISRFTPMYCSECKWITFSPSYFIHWPTTGHWKACRYFMSVTMRSPASTYIL